MTEKTADYRCKKRITDPEVFKKAAARMDDPNIITGKEGVYYLFKMMGSQLSGMKYFQNRDIDNSAVNYLPKNI